MKKLLTVGLISMGLVSTSVFAGSTKTWVYETSKHNIKITCRNVESYEDSDVVCSSEDCTYQSWNKPKQIGQGKPDLEIRKGSKDHSAHLGSTFDFTKGNKTISILNDEKMEISVNGRTQQKYRLKRKN